MKPSFHKVPTQLQSSFSARHDLKANFGTLWHYHPELELHYVVRGEGVRFIGDNISNFSSEEIVLLGSNLPHTWRCKEEYFENNPTHEVEAIVIHFLPECLGRDFLSLPEAYLVPKLLEKARKGMSFTGEAREKLSELMKAAIHASSLDRLIILLGILKIATETDEYQPIASAHAFYQSNESDVIRLNKICTYTLSNYKKDITLEEIASISNLSVTSFCRYFKLMTNKTFYDFLIEIRISHACRMLIDNMRATEIICFDCGFNNVSNFYRHFKKVTNLTPLQYKKEYLRG
ncbi:MAG: AraC family transcriptional regulator [Pedobacter sp.]|nr:MAG: AraC family transcriptional regulator [Pedobacter sp.]